MLDYDTIKTLLISHCFISDDESTSEIEIEIKFDDINYYQYDRLLQYIDGSDNNKEISTILFQEVDQVSSIAHKKSIILNEDGSESINWENKICVDTLHNDDYNVSILIIKKTVVDKPKVFESIFSRDKIKYLYKLKIDNIDCVIELTEVMEKNKKKIETKYECEVKYKHVNMSFTKTNITNLNNLLFRLLGIINNTNVVYTQSQKMQLITDCEQLLSVDTFNKADYLTVQTMGTEFIKHKESYIVSTKANGLRKLLIIHNTGIWLVNPPYEYNLLIGVSDEILPFINAWNTSIFDGQLIQPINNNKYDFNYKHWYLCYDCIMFKKINIQDDIYYNRIDKVKTLQIISKQYIDEDFLTISLKTTRSFNFSKNNIEQFYTNVRYILSLSKTLNYNHDGLIFISSNYYKSKSYKWISKPTIDFAIYNTVYPNIVKLYVYDSGSKRDIEFKGITFGDTFGLKTKYPFDVSMILQQSFNYFNNGKRKIVQCKWDNILHKMIGIDIRNDKLLPNTLEETLNIWELINEPITADDISGKTLLFMEYYFNDIVNTLLNSTKFQNTKVLNIKNENKSIINIWSLDSLSDKNNMVKEKVNVISIILSLSPYWINEKKLDSLVKLINNNLADNGKIIFLTLDGATVTELFESQAYDVKQINIGENELILDLNNRTVKIDFSTKRSEIATPTGLKIHNNIEYLVNIHDLTKKLNKYGIHLIKQQRADKDELLATETLLLSSLYTYGIYEKPV